MKVNRTAVVRFKTDSVERIHRKTLYQFSGENVSLHQAFLVWQPFSLSGDVGSFSRSCDNHVLIM